MMGSTKITRRNRFATDYAQQSPETQSTETELVIPEDLSTLSDADLTALATQVTEAFDGLYESGSDDGWSAADLETLSSLTEGLEVLQAEQATRTQAAEQRAEQAAELAARVRPEFSNQTPDEGEGEDEDEDTDETDGEDGDEEPADETDDTSDEGAAETVTASGPRRSRIVVDRSRVSRANARFGRAGKQARVEDVLFATGDGTGFANGQGINMLQAAQIVDRQLAGHQRGMYASAAQNGKHLRQQFNIATIRKPFAEGLTINSNDPMEVESVLKYAVDQKRLKGGSLIASGGWCAPSETLYDLLELESRDGLFSLPTTNWARGGISRTLGPSFSDLYTEITGFHYTEAEDIAGDYDGAGGGYKPCYKIDCPEFEEFRLELDGLCIQAGLLQRRGYPEMIARVLRGALIAHDHRMSARRIQAIATGSTAVTMPAPAQGATASILAAIEMQAESIRYAERLSRNATLEGVFPFWIRAVIRADLSRRLGVDLISVPDSRINAWFTERQIAAQFVYNYQDVAKTITAWPATAQFLLYPAGTWVEGASDVITIDNLFDSALVGTNDYTALFTEEGSKVVKMGHDSRAVTVSICADGATGGGIDYACDGTTVVPEETP